MVAFSGLFSWFRKQNTMTTFDCWNAIIDANLYQNIDHMIFLFTSAVEQGAGDTRKFPDAVLDKLGVVSIYHNKSTETPQHEFLVIETQDRDDKKMRLFILDRSGNDGLDATSNDAQIQTSRSPSRSVTPSMLEEGLAYPRTPTSYTSQPSTSEAISLSATQASHAILGSLDKGTMTKAVDKLHGEAYIRRSRFSKGQTVGQIQTHGLSLFQLLVLAQTIHEYAPCYSTLGRNCYWYASILMHTTAEIVGVDHVDSYLPQKSGTFKNFKIIQIKPQEIAEIVHDYKQKSADIIHKVKLFFQLTILY
jgi:hypothetical protein